MGRSSLVFLAATLVLCHSVGSVCSAGEDGESADSVCFPARSLGVLTGDTQVVTFEVAEAADRDREFAAAVADESLIEIESPPRVLAGHTLGFVRVRALGAGETALTIGSTTVAVRTLDAVVRQAVDAPRIVSPAPGTVVWGECSVGVEFGPHDARTAAAADLRLELPDGRRLRPDGVQPVSYGPTIRARFTLDTSRLPPGEARLVPVAQGADELAGEAVSVSVVRAGAGPLIRGECEDTLEFASDPRAPAPQLGSSPDASGERFVALFRGDPVWSVPVELERAGRYQMMVVARGDFAAGAFPSIGFCADDPQQPLTTVRVHDRRWQRVFVGVPVRLPAGRQVLGLRFLNPLALSESFQRGLYLDRFELLEVPADAGPSEAASMMMAAGGIAPGKGSGNGLWIALERSFHRRPVGGTFSIEGVCRWTGDDLAAPRVSLVVNGREVATQQTARPLFRLDAGALVEGENTIQLSARLADGRSGATAAQVVRVPASAAAISAREYHRFAVLDERWDEDLRATLSGEGQPGGRPIARLQPNTEVALELPESLSGEFQLRLEARGPDARPTSVKSRLRSESGELALDASSVQGWWNWVEGPRFALSDGPKTLLLHIDAAATDAEVASGSDPASRPDALWLRSLELRSLRAERHPPRITIDYPPPRHEVFGADAVVATGWDADDELQRAELIIDGRAQNVTAEPPRVPGPFVLPLPLRSLSPGEHSLQVRVRDAAGNLGVSEEVEFIILDQAPAQRGRYARAIHLLNRFAYGAEPQQLASLLIEGEAAWLERQLGPPQAGDLAALERARALQSDYNQQTIVRAALAHALRTDQPARLRATLWIENHFSTWIRKTNAGTKWFEHQRFLELGPAPFGDLLEASATSTAMLVYLDQASSYAGRINENYARELLELHTLGVDGGYTQADVTTLAEMLCGLTVAIEAPTDGGSAYLMREFRFDPSLGDGRARDLLGQRFAPCREDRRFDRLRLTLETLAAHPSTARFVSRKLAEHYVSTPAPDRLVDDLVERWSETGGDLRQLLFCIAEHPSFWADDSPSRLSTPLEFALHFGRSLGHYEVDYALISFLQNSGMGLFDCETPDGFAEGDAEWSDTNALLQRWKLPEDVHWAVQSLLPAAMIRGRSGDPEEFWQRAVDVVALRFLGRVLGEESNQAALDYVAASGATQWQLIAPLCTLICRMPEASLR